MHRTVLALLSIAFFLPQVTSAVVLTPSFDVVLQGASLIRTEATLSVKITARNEQNESQKGVAHLQIVSKDRGISITTIEQKEVILTPHVAQEITITTTPPGDLAGDFEVFFVLESLGGIPFAQTRVGTISIEPGPTERAFSIGSCVYEGEGGVFACTAEESREGGVSVRYVITRRSGGEVLFQDERDLAVRRGDVVVPLAAGVLGAGSYRTSMTFLDEAGVPVAVRDVTFTVPGPWVTITGFSSSFSGRTVKGELFLSGGGGTAEYRGLEYWIFDEQGSMCSGGIADFRTRVPGSHAMNHVLPSTCRNPHIAGFVYNGQNSDGSLVVSETFGDAPLETLRALSSARDFGADTSDVLPLTYGGILFDIILLVILVGVVFLLLQWRRFFVRMLGIGAFVLLLLPGVTSATTFVDGNDVFTVTLDQASYRVGEPITFTFGLEDTSTGDKPLFMSVEAALDGESLAEIVSEEDTGTVYSIEINAAASAGDFDINFAVPGDFFGTAFFGSSRFTTDTRTFSVPVTISPNTAPATPSVIGACVVDQSNTIGFVSTDSDGDTLYYDVYFDAEGSSERLPTSGYVSSGTQLSTARTWSTVGPHTAYARSTDTFGATLGWTSASLTCTYACEHCINDGGSSDVSITANPSWIQTDTPESVDLTWVLANIDSCTVAGSNGDSWDWDAVRQYQTRMTSLLDESTVFVLSCDDGSGGTVQASVTVGPLPTFQEI